MASNFGQQALVWVTVSTIFFVDFCVNSKLVIYVLPSFFSPRLAVFFEATILLLCCANAIYCFKTYLFFISKLSLQNASQKLKRVVSTPRLNCSSATANSFNISNSLNVSNLLGADRATCLSSISNFLDNFFKASAVKSNVIELSSPINTSYLSAKDASITSTVGYHDSPLNKSVSSIYTQQQLEKLLSDESCNLITESSTSNLFTNSFCDDDRLYKAGTPMASPEHNEDTVNLVKKFVLSKKARSPSINRTMSDTFKRTRESSPINAFTSSGLTAVGSIGKLRYHESETDKIFLHYGIKIVEVEEYELKLRVWMCNTILRPLILKIDEMNTILKEKFASLHLKIGVTSPEALKAHLSSRMDLCNSYLPFILPYLRIHSNQNYIVNRIRTLANNVAIEEFKWNSGGAETSCDETDGLLKSLAWSERLPTDSKVIWFAFCTYMDFHLAPCPNYISGNFFKPFSNVYFLKSDATATALHTAPDSFFIRLASENPPIFEFIISNDVFVPSKESGNLWLVMLLFLAHADKSNFSRIGHLHMSTISLDIFNK